MLYKSSFITSQFRPDVRGSLIDSHYQTPLKLNLTGSPGIPVACLNTEQARDDEPREVRESYLKFLEYETIQVNSICFGPRKDNVLINLEHFIEESDQILVFYYEDIFIRWSYICHSGDICFIYQKDERNAFVVRTKCIYMRGCMVTPESKYWKILGDFYNLMSLWKGKIICNPASQMSNESKLFQLNNSLLTASKAYNNIKIGTSFVIKGKAQFLQLNQDKSYVVKSLSGVRSIVVDQSEYAHWDRNALDNLPVLFQEKIQGMDIRFHILENKLYGKQSSDKESVDYRYDRHFFELTTITSINKSLPSFCQTVAALEKNNLMGIDFIKRNNTYYVLEANPCPGWSSYHPYNGIDSDDFLSHILCVLRND